MHRVSIRAAGLAVAAAVAVAGCATPKPAPVAYRAAQDRFGAIVLPVGRPLVVCPTIDGLDPQCRQRLGPAYPAAAHVTQALEAELRASGIAPVRAGFATGGSLAALRNIVAEQPRPPAGTVYLGSQIRWLADNRWTLDAALLAPTGEVLFEKRGFCLVLGVPRADVQEVAHMAMRQILADPKFREALQ